MAARDLLSNHKLRQIQSIMERDPDAYSEIEVCLLRQVQNQTRREKSAARLVWEQQAEMRALRERVRHLEERLGALSTAVHSAAEAAGRSLVDWEQDRELAWIFGILRGWAECEEALAQRFEWSPRQVAALRRYGAAVGAVSENS